jgi:hypothetical protein
MAVEELAKPEYHVDDPSLFQRAVTWIIDKISDLIDRASQVVPGGPWGLAVIALVIIVVIAAVLWRGGPVRRSSAVEGALFVGRPRSAAEHRAAADRAAAAGSWEEAVLERYRAIVRSLEERTVLEPRPGRTADEAAAEAGVALPLLAKNLKAAADTFDAVVYGGRAATPTDDRFLRELDQAATATTPRAHAAGVRW